MRRKIQNTDLKSQNAFEPQMHFNIKEVADMVGVVPATIRNWEKAGLFTSKRSASNYRYFDFNDIEFLKRISELSSEGMSISFIRRMISQDTNTVSMDLKPSNFAATANDYSAKLHQCRRDKHYTLVQVSDAIGISPSYLSRIEQGKCNITLGALQKLTEFYGEDMTSFLDQSTDKSPLVKNNEGLLLEKKFEGVKIYSLMNYGNPSFNVSKVIVQPGCGLDRPHNHKSGSESIYVLKGSFTVILDEEKYVIEAGDTLTFNGGNMHQWFNDSNIVAELLWYHAYV